MANVRVCSLTLALTLLCSGCSTTQVNTRSMGRHKHRSSRRQYAGQRRGRADRRQQWRIAPYSGIRYTATVRTGKKIKTGEAIFRISIGDAENREYDWLEFAIPTER